MSRATIVFVSTVALLALGSILICSVGHAGPFRNLNFEETEGVQTGVPGWEIPEGVDYLYNRIFAGEGSLTLFNSRFPFGYSPLEGDQSLLLVYDPIGSFPATGGSLFQTGDVPTDAARIEMLVTDMEGIRVSMNHVTIPLTVRRTFGGVQLVSGDIAGFAGTSATLVISSPFGTPNHKMSAVDAIRFVVPEPATCGWTAIGILALIARGRCRGRGEKDATPSGQETRTRLKRRCFVVGERFCR